MMKKLFALGIFITLTSFSIYGMQNEITQEDASYLIQAETELTNKLMYNTNSSEETEAIIQQIRNIKWVLNNSPRIDLVPITRNMSRSRNNRKAKEEKQWRYSDFYN
jgi:hypothetical protein